MVPARTVVFTFHQTAMFKCMQNYRYGVKVRFLLLLSSRNRLDSNVTEWMCCTFGGWKGSFLRHHFAFANASVSLSAVSSTSATQPVQSCAFASAVLWLLRLVYCNGCYPYAQPPDVITKPTRSLTVSECKVPTTSHWKANKLSHNEGPYSQSRVVTRALELLDTEQLKA